MCSLKRRVDSLDKKLNCEDHELIILVGDTNTDWEKLKGEYIKKNGIDPENIGRIVQLIDKFGPQSE